MKQGLERNTELKEGDRPNSFSTNDKKTAAPERSYGLEEEVFYYQNSSNHLVPFLSNIKERQSN